jgi:hypothetical protein
MSAKSAEPETVVRELPCELTDAELLERGNDMAACEVAVDELKAERRRLNASIREKSDRRADLAKIIESKAETRDVPCTWEPDYDLKRYDLIRTDTKAPIEQREMPEADLQMRLLPEPTPIAKGKTTRKRASN